MYFWLNFSDNNHIERIPVGVKNIDHIFYMASEIESNKLYLFLLSDGSLIEDNEYLDGSEANTKLNFCTDNRSRNC